MSPIHHAGDDTRRMTRLYAFTSALSNADSPEEVVQVTVREVQDATGAYGVTFHEVTADGEALKLAGSLGYEPEALVPYKLVPLSVELPMAQAAREAAPVFLEAEQFERQFPSTRPHHLPRATCSASIPLLAEDDVLAVLSLSFHERRAFNASEQEFILAFTSQCAQALQRARLARSVHTKREETGVNP